MSDGSRSRSGKLLAALDGAIPEPESNASTADRPRSLNRLASTRTPAHDKIPASAGEGQMRPSPVTQFEDNPANTQFYGNEQKTEQVTQRFEALELPKRRVRRPIGGIVSFLLCVVLPVVIASVYYIGYASNQYIAEFRFAVRDTSTSGSSPVGGAGLGALLGISSTPNSEENYMVTDYLTSVQAVEDLEKRIKVREFYSRPTIDWWSRFDSALPLERFARYWRFMTIANYDQITGTAAAQVRAFTPEDAYLIATTLVSLSEDLVNEVSQRPQREAVLYAEAEVRRAEDRLKLVRAQMTEYRNKESVIDPNSSIVMSNAALASTVRQTLTQYQTDLAVLQKQGLQQNSHQAQSLRNRIKATQEQLKEIESEISNTKQRDTALSTVVGNYEQLDMERQFAQAMVTSTMQTLEQVRANAIAKRIFVTPYVRPYMPQASLYPNRVVAILTVAGVCFMVWTVALLVVRSIREHLA